MIEREIREQMHILFTELRKRYAKQFTPLDLYVGQEAALLHLWEKDGLSQTELRQLVGCEASTMSNMIRKLEMNEIIYRERHKYDARRSLVYLTDKGKALEKPVMCILEAEQERLLDGLVAEERLLMRRMLQQMVTNVIKEE